MTTVFNNVDNYMIENTLKLADKIIKYSELETEILDEFCSITTKMLDECDTLMCDKLTPVMADAWRVQLQIASGARVSGHDPRDFGDRIKALNECLNLMNYVGYQMATLNS